MQYRRKTSNCTKLSKPTPINDNFSVHLTYCRNGNHLADL